MPELSRFLGIVIGMFFNEHGPPHFHAVYGEHKITVEIESGHVTGHFRHALSVWCLNGPASIGKNYWQTGSELGGASRSRKSSHWSAP
jgi:hypothetical protein